MESCCFGVMTELLAVCRKKKSKKRKTGSDESDAEEQVVWMEKKSKPALLAVYLCLQYGH